MLRRLPTLILALALTGSGLAAGFASGAAQADPAAGTAHGSSSKPATRPASKPAHHRQPVITRKVSFDVVNNTDALLGLSCSTDHRRHVLRGELVGPANLVKFGSARPYQVSVLLHDAGTGSWFWHPQGQPRYDYATAMARHGQVSLVLDQLGYDRSPLANGNATCLDAQATMTHQVVQALYAGAYHVTGGTPRAVPHVVLQGHGTGATIAAIEASRFHDVRGVVLMSMPDASPSALATRVLAQQTRVCRSRDYAPYGSSSAQFKHLLFATAPASVRSFAVRHRNATPCGDVDNTAAAVGSSLAGAGSVSAPVLQLNGSRDARGRASRFDGGGRVSMHTVKGGSALPLEKSAPSMRRIVLHWLGTLRGF